MPFLPSSSLPSGCTLRTAVSMRVWREVARVLRERAVDFMLSMLDRRVETTESQRADHVLRMVRRAGRDCGRRSRRGATEWTCAVGGVELGERWAVIRPE